MAAFLAFRSEGRVGHGIKFWLLDIPKNIFVFGTWTHHFYENLAVP